MFPIFPTRMVDFYDLHVGSVGRYTRNGMGPETITTPPWRLFEPVLIGKVKRQLNQ